jgi:hypothetical protein
MVEVVCLGRKARRTGTVEEVKAISPSIAADLDKLRQGRRGRVALVVAAQPPSSTLPPLCCLAISA